MGNTNKIALSIDVEDWYHAPIMTGYSFSKHKNVDDFFNSWKDRYDYMTQGFLSMMEILDKKNITATFFIVADIIERYPEVVELLKSSKHEIACHSLHHQIPFNPQSKQKLQTEKEWEDDLILSKNLLEDFFDTKIIGYRAPGAFFNDWMLPILKKNGFLYDSSVAYNSIYNKTNKDISKIPKYPYAICHDTMNELVINNNDALIELPWSNYKISNLTLPAGGAFFFRLLGPKYFKRALDYSLLHGDTMFYMHPIDFSNEKFPLHNHYKRPLYWINQGSKTLKYFEQLLDNYEGRWTTCKAIYEKNKKRI